jgi:hypothetical protein
MWVPCNIGTLRLGGEYMEQLLNLTFAQAIGSVAGIVVVISIFIEIMPIKVNPVSHFLKWLGRKINGDIIDRFDNLEKKVVNIENVNDERNAISCRVRILQFGDEVRRGLCHSKENFDQILSDIDDYERYCETHPEFKNNKTVVTKEKIIKVYSERVDNNDFL